jgi:hypothetical protein
VYPPKFWKFIVSDCVRIKPAPPVRACRGWTATHPGNNIYCDNFIFVKSGRIAVACLAAFSNTKRAAGGGAQPGAVQPKLFCFGGAAILAEIFVVVPYISCKLSDLRSVQEPL